MATLSLGRNDANFDGAASHQRCHEVMPVFTVLGVEDACPI
ncbi:MAG: hypothetical protein ABJZ79_16390 [Parasphingorhabdus sp.]